MIKIIDGKKIAQTKQKELLQRMGKSKKTIGLAVILVGNDPASWFYVKQKEKIAKEISVTFSKYIFKENPKEEKEIIEAIKWLNQDDQINGILIQLPLPPGFNTAKIIKTINPAKDVDGLKKSKFTSPFIRAIYECLLAINFKIASKRILILSKTDLFGQKLVAFFKSKNLKADYVLADSKNLKAKTTQADILISACGYGQFLKRNLIKKGAILIDGGFSLEADGVVGDVDQIDVKDKAAWLTPVPGGVGPLTVFFLFENTFLASLEKNDKVKR